ncbi:MAG: hypothetical protein UCP03_01285, partial [Alistipes onderdonkii]
PQRPHDAHTGTAAVPGTGNRGSLRNRADSAPAKIMQANRYYPQRYRKSSEYGKYSGCSQIIIKKELKKVVF